MEKRTYKKIAYVLSLCVFLLWAALGTGTSLAWFTDTTTEIKNVFHTAEFELKVSHRTEGGWYEVIDGTTQIFDDEALYEPGYTQVVYLKVKNEGTIPFDMKTAVSITDYTVATNVFGRSFELRDYLKFGFVMADTEAELDEKVATRAMAAAAATMPLNNYSTDTVVMEAGQTKYMALIVRMPEEVGNEANYRGDTIPKVELGVIVEATQIT
ncbi:MAG: hypothetical protein J6J43_00185 [Oscillospiraceae bacterium]|nr:hypothetical protein [Oscillospiraceae bacterium]